LPPRHPRTRVAVYMELSGDEARPPGNPASCGDGERVIGMNDAGIGGRDQLDDSAGCVIRVRGQPG